jgi:hypothetical protein
MYFIVHETQSMIHCADIPHGFAKGGLHPTLQEPGLPIKCLIHDRWKYKSSRRALAPGFADLEIQPGLAPRPARKKPQCDRPQFAQKPELFSGLILNIKILAYPLTLRFF